MSYETLEFRVEQLMNNSLDEAEIKYNNILRKYLY